MALHRGKLAREPRITGIRALTREDLLTLRDAPRVTPKVKFFRGSHHRLARLDAAGWRVEEILRVTGYSYQRLCTLRKDPAYQELLAKFRAKVEEGAVEIILSAEQEVQEASAELINRGLHHYAEHFDRADEAGELVPVGTLTKIIPDLMDRFGYGKHSTTTTKKIDTARIMEAALTRSGRSTVIDGRTQPALPPPPEEGISSPPSSGEPIPFVVGIRRR